MLKIDNKRHGRIRDALALKGVSLSDIARSLEVSPSSVSIVSKGHRGSRRIEKAIADALGQPPESLWPERYGDDESGQSD
jgi:lambda repressor-like predicted transcriptional regulator|nr:helix-turn-helix domain-containing protein [uncultured Brevundimonas sp.]|tara:strand:- start:62340 stop:62579 length:240 start_codon:yes stop_codon:yes gene_type:complete